MKPEIEELRLKMVHKDVAKNAVKKTMMELDEQVECVETEKLMLLKTNKKVLQRSSSTKNRRSVESKTLVDSLPDQFTGVAVKVENWIRRCCNEEVSELSQFGAENELNWTNRRESAGVSEVDRQDGLKFVSYFPILLSTHGTHFATFETEAEVVLKEPAAKKSGVEQWLRTASTGEVQLNALKAVSFTEVLRNNMKQALSDTCIMCKRAGLKRYCRLLGTTV